MDLCSAIGKLQIFYVKGQEISKANCLIFISSKETEQGLSWEFETTGANH
jgi:hypothetical protein